MIKFFRKIRQNLLSEGKTGKYLKYAFGEIILGVTERLSMLIGSLNLEERLENQKELKAELRIDENANDVILALEAIQEWMHFSESKSIRQLRGVVNEIDAVERLILEEVE